MDNQKTTQIEEEIRLYAPGGAPRIVAIGGGHGLSTMLRGIKRYSRDITAIVTMADDGGGSMPRSCRRETPGTACWLLPIRNR